MRRDTRPLLDGVRIADFTTQAAGPYATELLALMGAEIIRIESRLRPDMMRQRSAIRFNEVNLNKKDLTLDLTQPKAREIVAKLARVSDVIIESFRPGVMDKLGIGYKTLSQANPKLIMLSLSGFGATGPEASHSAYAPMFAAQGGLSYITGYPGGIPTEMRTSIDFRAGEQAAFGILGALIHRRRTGQGQCVDFAATEGVTCLIGHAVMDYTINGRVPGPVGNEDSVASPHNCYRCKGENEWITIAIYNDQEWQAFCQAIGNPLWCREEKFATQLSRWQNRKQLDDLVSSHTTECRKEELVQTLQKAGIAATACYSAADVYRDPHLLERHFLVEMEYPDGSKHRHFAAPWRLSESPLPLFTRAPEMGRDSLYVLRDLLGLSEPEIEVLEAEKVIW